MTDTGSDTVFGTETGGARTRRSCDEFLSKASHELKTPLSVLGLQLQLAQRWLKANKSGSAPARVENLIDDAVKQVRSLTDLIDDLLDAARIQNNSLTLAHQPTHLAALVCNVATRYSSYLSMARCRLEIDVDENIDGIWDTRRIEQILLNLLSNAVKYAPGSFVKIQGRLQDTKSILIFEDNGPGIAPENHQRVFDSFERVGGGIQPGLGLGLYVIKQIVRAHQGVVRMESSPGRGTRFTIELPLDPCSLESPALTGTGK